MDPEEGGIYVELYTPQGGEMVSGMIYEPDEQGEINSAVISLLDTSAS